ncbi:MAG TPA: TIR domain-containing protein [Sphingomicrobium sp.]|nr:TIR domain-containing protein [Sphingomicrobium sp.]
MSDVFISYARSSEDQAKRVEEGLKSAGYAVWRDDELPAHRSYADVIQERLKLAKAVVVLWGAEAAQSQWVRSEADAARQLGTLVQATIDGSIPPMPFDQIQCADLREWNGGGDTPGWRKLVASVEALAQAVTPNNAPSGRKRARDVSVCVLPFVNMSGDVEQEYFSDGISEDITTDLSKVSALEVIARNTAFQFKRHSIDVCDVAKKLGVSHVLEGSVRKAGDRVRITAQLIDGSSGAHVWADRYDRDLNDIFAIQDEISKAIVAALRVTLLPREKKAIEQRGTTNIDAYNLYLMARNEWATGNHGDIQREDRVIRLCERSVGIDPFYADAWALLANAQSSRCHAFGKPGDCGVEAAEKALSIDPSIAEAYCPIVRVHIEQKNYAEAEKELERALAVGPESWEVHHEAVRVHVRQRHFRDATHHLEKQVSLMDSDYYGWGMLLSYYHALGEEAEAKRVAKRALEEAGKALEHDSNNGAAMSVAARSLATLGASDAARDLIERGLLLDPDNLNMSYNFGAVYAAQLGEREAALELVCGAIAKASGTLIRWAEVDPDVDSLRGQARFDSMLAEAKARTAKA